MARPKIGNAKRDRVILRAERQRVETWKQAAGRQKQSLSAWIRYALDRAARLS